MNGRARSSMLIAKLCFTPEDGRMYVSVTLYSRAKVPKVATVFSKTYNGRILFKYERPRAYTRRRRRYTHVRPRVLQLVHKRRDEHVRRKVLVRDVVRPADVLRTRTDQLRLELRVLARERRDLLIGVVDERVRPDREALRTIEEPVAQARAELEAAEASGPLHIRVVGLARIAADVSPELARAAIGSITVLGALQAPAAVKAALRDRTR